MKVTILGSGTCVPRLDRSAAAVLVETGEAKLLIDAGPGTMRRLLECGVTIFDLTHVLITHFHPDHTAELSPLLFATKYPDASARSRALTIIGAVGLKRFYKGLQAAYGDWIVLPEDCLIVDELQPGADRMRVFDDFTITAYPAAHRPESLAYRIQSGDGAVIAYSGDSDYCDGLVEAARKADLFICESAFPDDLKVPGHMTPSLAGRIAQAARVRHLVLTHLYPPCDDADIVKQAANAYKEGPVTAAQDLLSFDLEGGRGT